MRNRVFENVLELYDIVDVNYNLKPNFIYIDHSHRTRDASNKE